MTQYEEISLSSLPLPKLIKLRNERKDSTAKANKIAKLEKEKLDEVESVIITKLDEIGVEGTHVDGHSVNITEEFVPTDIDWNTFIPWAVKNDQLHLLQRRMSATAWREYEVIAGDYPPGTTPYKQRKLSVTKRKSNKK